MMHLSLKDSGSLGILTLRGNLIDHSVGELQNLLSRALVRVDRLIVNIEHVTSVDSGRLRLLCTAYRVSQLYGKEFTVAGDRSAPLLAAVTEAGLGNCQGSRGICQQGCLWQEGGSRQSHYDDPTEAIA